METAAIEHMSAADVLADLRACDQLERQVTARRLALAARWADLNPSIQTLPEAVDRTMTDDELGIGLAAVAEFAAVHAVTTQTGRTLIADALELRHRLPKLWHAVHELHIAAWKACAVAQTTRPRSTELAAALNTQTATLGDRLTLRRIKKLALQAVARFEPDTLPDPDTRRWLRITADTATTSGAVWVDGRLDTPDALDLETAVRAVSRQLARNGSTDDLDHRRAHALGIIARHALGLPETDTQCGNAAQPGTIGATAPHAGRAVQLYVHLDADTFNRVQGISTRRSAAAQPDNTAIASGVRLAEVGTTDQLVTVEQIRRWCSSAGTITVRPVIDLAANHEASGYRPTPTQREQIALRDRTCVFPHCTRPAHPLPTSADDRDQFSHDADHIVAYDAGGETSSTNLACLCRHHHRLKTHTGWRYVRVGPSDYLWTSPTGLTFLRTATGSTELPEQHPRVRKRAA